MSSQARALPQTLALSLSLPLLSSPTLTLTHILTLTFTLTLTLALTQARSRSAAARAAPPRSRRSYRTLAGRVGSRFVRSRRVRPGRASIGTRPASTAPAGARSKTSTSSASRARSPRSRSSAGRTSGRSREHRTKCPHRAPTFEGRRYRREMDRRTPDARVAAASRPPLGGAQPHASRMASRPSSTPQPSAGEMQASWWAHARSGVRRGRLEPVGPGRHGLSQRLAEGRAVPCGGP